MQITKSLVLRLLKRGDWGKTQAPTPRRRTSALSALRERLSLARAASASQSPR